MTPPRKQRGIALLTAIILVALATVLAVSIAFGTAMTARRGAASFTIEQGLQFGGAAEALAAVALQQDMGTRGASGTQQDFPAERWADHFGPVEIAPDVVMEAQLGDESGKFNLNSLIDGADAVDDNAMEVFQSLLEHLGLDKKWGPLLADWIDKNSNTLPGGGEDNVYTLQKPGYRAANTWITSPSELMSLPDFKREDYLKLLPHVTALPPQSRAINVCFASPELLDSLLSVLDQSQIQQYSQPANLKALQLQREKACFPAKTTFKVNQTLQTSLSPDRWQHLQKLERDVIVDQSTYFQLRTWVSIGTTRFALYSLITRDPQGAHSIQVVHRTFGTE